MRKKEIFSQIKIKSRKSLGQDLKFNIPLKIEKCLEEMYEFPDAYDLLTLYLDEVCVLNMAIKSIKLRQQKINKFQAKTCPPLWT